MTLRHAILPLALLLAVPGLAQAQRGFTVDDMVALDRYSSPLSLKTGIWDTAIRTDWKQQAQVVIRHGNPLPATILAIIPEVTLGG